MLPGGGIDEGDLLQGLKREILEEIGCNIKIVFEIGPVEVYFDRWKQKQTDYCFIAKKITPSNTRHITDFEREEGHEVIWAPSLEEAINLVAEISPKNLDGKLIQSRELFFLKEAIKISRRNNW
jgi:8-oxo-dGTP pyrophosphatase MutT (NUDIX family)